MALTHRGPGSNTKGRVMKWLKVLAVWLLLASTAVAKYPYDSVGRVAAGGTCTMVEVADGKGLMTTCAHVVATVGETDVYWPAVKQTRKCKTVYVNYDLDIALLVCDNPPVPAVSVKENKEGSPLIAAGFPYYDRAALHWQPGMVLGSDDTVAWTTNRPVAGMSGGAGFDTEGNLIGIVRLYNEFFGGMVAGDNLIIVVQLYADPKTWIPDDSHKQNPKKFKLADQNGDVRTKKYDAKEAPDLMPKLKQEKAEQFLIPPSK